MDKNKIKTRSLTVANVKQAMKPYGDDEMHTMSQVLQMFGVAPKLERIIWALLKKDHLRRKRVAEETTYGAGGYDPEDVDNKHLRRDRKATKLAGSAKPTVKPPEEIVEPPVLETVVGICNKCGGNLVGTPIPGCSKIKKQPVFYKECVTCATYSEIWKEETRNKVKHYEVEGG